jgi:hypothetical protein
MGITTGFKIGICTTNNTNTPQISKKLSIENKNTNATVISLELIQCLLMKDAVSAFKLMLCSKLTDYSLTASESNYILEKIPFTPSSASSEDIPTLKKWLSQFPIDKTTILTFQFHRIFPTDLFLEALLCLIPVQNRKLLSLELFDKQYFNGNDTFTESIHKLKKNTQSDIFIVTSSRPKKSRYDSTNTSLDFIEASLFLTNTLPAIKKQNISKLTIAILLHSLNQTELITDKKPVIFDSINESAEELFSFLKFLADLKIKYFFLMFQNFPPIKVTFLYEKILPFHLTVSLKKNSQAKIVFSKVSELFDSLLFIDQNSDINLGHARSLDMVSLPIEEIFLINPNNL